MRYNEKEPVSCTGGDFKYCVQEDGDGLKHAVIVNYTGSAEELILPSRLDGIVVNGLGDSSFSGNTALRRVVFPDTITRIGRYAFFNCPALSCVRLPKQLEWIGDNAFNTCRNLAAVSIPESIGHAGTGIFRECPKLPRSLSRNRIFNPLYWDGSDKERERLEALCPFRPFLQNQAEDPDRYLKAAESLCWRKADLSKDSFYTDFQNNGSFEEISIFVFTFPENDIPDGLENILLQCGIMTMLPDAPCGPENAGYYAALWENMASEKRRKTAAAFSDGFSDASLAMLAEGELINAAVRYVNNSSYIGRISEILAPYNGIPVIEIEHHEDVEDAFFWLGMLDNRIILVEYLYVMPN